MVLAFCSLVFRGLGGTERIFTVPCGHVRASERRRVQLLAARQVRPPEHRPTAGRPAQVCTRVSHAPEGEWAPTRRRDCRGADLRSVNVDKRHDCVCRHDRLAAVTAATAAGDALVWCRRCEDKQCQAARDKAAKAKAKVSSLASSGASAASRTAPRRTFGPRRRRGDAPGPVCVTCKEPQGRDPKRRMAIGKPVPPKHPSPGRCVTVDFDVEAERLRRMRRRNPLCSPANFLRPETEQAVVGGSLQVTSWCDACGRPESFNLAGLVRKGRSTEARPCRTDLEAVEFGLHGLGGGQLRRLRRCPDSRAATRRPSQTRRLGAREQTRHSLVTTPPTSADRNKKI